MPEESYSFATARTRLEEIVVQVRKKDTSLEKSLDLLEEGVRLANQCTELIDHADWEAAGDGDAGVCRVRRDDRRGRRRPPPLPPTSPPMPTLPRKKSPQTEATRW